MKLRNVLLALVLPFMATALSAQTMTATAWAAKARAARSVANDLRHKHVQKATATLLKDKDLRRHVHVNQTLEAKLTNPNLVRDLKKAKTDARRDPVTFGEKSVREFHKYKKYAPKWMHRKSKRHATHKR